MSKWESYQERIMYTKRGERIGRYKRCSLRICHGSFMFRIHMNDHRQPWLNDRKKFYSSRSLRDFNIRRKTKGWTLTSPLEWRKRYENVVYWGEY